MFKPAAAPDDLCEDSAMDAKKARLVCSRCDTSRRKSVVVPSSLCSLTQSLISSWFTESTMTTLRSNLLNFFAAALSASSDRNALPCSADEDEAATSFAASTAGFAEGNTFGEALSEAGTSPSGLLSFAVCDCDVEVSDGFVEGSAGTTALFAGD